METLLMFLMTTCSVLNLLLVAWIAFSQARAERTPAPSTAAGRLDPALRDMVRARLRERVAARFAERKDA
jgi:hypothetical protein